MKVSTLATLLLFAMVAVAPAAQSLDDVVAANYPSVLADIAAQHHYAETREQAYVSLSDAATQYVVAAYSNGHVAAVVLLERTAAGATPLQVIRDHQTGAEPSITAIDLDADRRPEIVVSFMLGPRGGAETWIYRLANGRLSLISPVDARGNTELGLPEIVDFGAGAMDLVDQANIGTRDEPILRYSHYVLQGGTYVEHPPLDFYRLFFRDKGAPHPDTSTFSVPASEIGSRFHLTVINGGSNGKPCRVGSGTITLNGVVVSPPSDFSESRAAWTLPVTLQQNNTITVQLNGPPGGRVAIAIRHD